MLRGFLLPLGFYFISIERITEMTKARMGNVIGSQGESVRTEKVS